MSIFVSVRQVAASYTVQRKFALSGSGKKILQSCSGFGCRAFARMNITPY